MRSSTSAQLPAAPENLVAFLQRYRSFAIVGHVDPDGDALGSQIALGSALERTGARVHLVNPGPFDRQEITPLEERFAARIGLAPVDAIIVVDCSSADRIGPVADELTGHPVAVIDHHRTGTPFGDVLFVDPDIPANTILILSVIEALGLEPTQDEAEALFLGLATDTGFFRFLDAGERLALDVAARLVACGVSPRAVEARIASGRSYGSRRLLARMIDRSTAVDGGRGRVTWQCLDDDHEFGTRRDTDALYRLLLTTEGVEAVAVVREKEGGCTVSLRSTDSFDVSALAASLGGGGHRRASGAFIKADLTAARERVESVLEDALRNHRE